MNKPVRERDVESYLTREIKRLGGEIRKVQWIGRRGAPDRKIMHPHFGCWVELKRPGEKVSGPQAREIERMKSMGEQVFVLDSIEAVNRFINKHYVMSGNAAAGALLRKPAKPVMWNPDAA